LPNRTRLGLLVRVSESLTDSGVTATELNPFRPLFILRGLGHPCSEPIEYALEVLPHHCELSFSGPEWWKCDGFRIQVAGQDL